MRDIEGVRHRWCETWRVQDMENVKGWEIKRVRGTEGERHRGCKI